MRVWGIAFLGTVVGGVTLPDPLKWWPLAIVAVAGAITLATTYADRRERVEAAQAADTQKTLDYLAGIRAAIDDVDAEWDQIMGAIGEGQPLTACADRRPARLHLVTPRVPAMRTPGSAS
ncbi:hypothetical protein [Nocardioides marmoriginsengisoli]|uniref:hypothetical protein n=1 Tax=Nocardioides marmoriginsengisoli TaxID=661483 RepID=UPI001620C56B|nr:hypothetical protein [Nocardioides marmoriginsengisoli]